MPFCSDDLLTKVRKQHPAIIYRSPVRSKDTTQITSSTPVFYLANELPMASKYTEDKKQPFCIAGLCSPLQNHLTLPWLILDTHREHREIACSHSACWTGRCGTLHWHADSSGPIEQNTSNTLLSRYFNPETSSLPFYPKDITSDI